MVLEDDSSVDLNDRHENEMFVDDGELKFSSSKTKFQTLLDLKTQGSAAVFKDVQGAYSGRCYTFANPNTPSNTALLITEELNDDGPLFPSDKWVIEAGVSTMPADFFDSRSKEDITSTLIPFKEDYFSVVEDPLSVVLRISQQSEDTITFVKSGKYLVAYWTANDDRGRGLRSGGSVKGVKGKVFVSCYYFIKK
jgi:hypothetical protein